jgi:hypothetical protein
VLAAALHPPCTAIQHCGCVIALYSKDLVVCM